MIILSISAFLLISSAALYWRAVYLDAKHNNYVGRKK